MKVLLLAVAAFALLLFGCASGPSINPPGSDRDAYGCIPSAGYTWCAAKSKCIRPWEENCTAAQMPKQPVKDSFGCITSDGYSWCEPLKKCIKPSAENCTAANATNITSPPVPQIPLGSLAQAFCGRPNTAAVYVCGDYVRVVSSLEGGGSRFYKDGVGQPVRCPIVSPDSETEECRQLLSGSNCTEKKIC